jgi:serine/threonine protein phosphatase 1
MTSGKAEALNPIPRRKLIVGDIHGMQRSLLQALERAAFDPDLDELICLGDLVDRGPQVAEVLDYVDNLPRFRLVLGNHDEMAERWLRGTLGIRDGIGWQEKMGGDTTVDALRSDPDRWEAFFDRAHDYIEEDACLLVHAGLVPSYPMEEQTSADLRWSRYIAQRLLWNEPTFDENGEREAPPAEAGLTSYRRVYVGHTPAGEEDDWRPVRRREFWFLDQGAVYGGRLTVMDMASEQYWQSDLAADLYPELAGT